jgi:hypothetical protein
MKFVILVTLGFIIACGSANKSVVNSSPKEGDTMYMVPGKTTINVLPPLPQWVHNPRLCDSAKEQCFIGHSFLKTLIKPVI